MGSLSEGSYAQGQTWDVGHDFVAVAELHLGDLPVSTIRLFWCRNVHLARQRKQQISKMRYIAWQSVTKDNMHYALGHISSKHASSKSASLKEALQKRQ